MLWLACADEGKDEILDEKNDPRKYQDPVELVPREHQVSHRGSRALSEKAGLCLKKTVWITAVAKTATTWVYVVW